MKVLKTIDNQAQGATIEGYSTEVENGKRIYEAEMIMSGRTKNIEVAADGTLIEIEEELASIHQVFPAKDMSMTILMNLSTLTRRR